MDPQTSSPDPQRNSRNTPGVVVSLLLVAAGVLLLLDHMGIVEAAYLFRFWPTGVILLGAVIAAQPDPSSRIWGGTIALGGVILLLRSLGYVNVEFWSIFWPLAMIGGGINLLWAVITGQPIRSMTGHRFRVHRRGHLRGTPFFQPGYWEKASVMNEAAVFGGGDRSHVGEFEGGRLSAVFGGYQVDLTQAEITGDSAYLHIAVVFGGAEIHIPHNWDLVMRGVPIFGGYSDRTRHPQRGPGTKTLFIVGAAIFGGVEVKN
ncbi:MAG TPA: DUF5668 domain-containing protein [Bryobacteraceae bacterium]|nr:DUF5668 domain-containing protein [Bryobacteraceae bacterium]